MLDASDRVTIPEEPVDVLDAGHYIAAGEVGLAVVGTVTEDAVADTDFFEEVVTTGRGKRVGEPVNVRHATVVLEGDATAKKEPTTSSDFNVVGTVSFKEGVQGCRVAKTWFQAALGEITHGERVMAEESNKDDQEKSAHGPDPET